MNNKTLMAALGALALTVAAVPAQAQTSTPTGLSLKLGVLWPSNKSVRDATSDTWFLGGIEYRFKDMPVTTPGMTSHLSVSADYASSGNNHFVPVLLNYVGEQRQTYWMIGAGAAFDHFDGSDNTRFAYQVGFGYNFEQGGTTPAFIEARYIGTSESREAGVAVDVGIRF